MSIVSSRHDVYLYGRLHDVDDARHGVDDPLRVDDDFLAQEDILEVLHGAEVVKKADGLKQLMPQAEITQLTMHKRYIKSQYRLQI